MYAFLCVCARAHIQIYLFTTKLNTAALNTSVNDGNKKLVNSGNDCSYQRLIKLLGAVIITTTTTTTTITDSLVFDKHSCDRTTFSYIWLEISYNSVNLSLQ